MELVNLKAFVTVAEYGSLRKAAEALFVSEGTVSRQVKTLEQELRIELFTRTHKHLQMTHAGKRLLEEARRVLRSVESFERMAQGVAKDWVQSLSVGYSGLSYEEEALIAATLALRDAFPGLSVAFEVDRSSGLVEKVQEGRLDMALLYDASVPDVPMFCTERLGYARGMIMVPKSHRLAQLSEISLLDLEGERILLEYRDSSPLMHDMAAERFREEGLDSLDRVYATDYRSIPPMVATGQGVALCSSWMDNPLPKSIVMKELKGSRAVACVAMWLRGGANPIVEAFADVLRLYFGQAYPSG